MLRKYINDYYLRKKYSKDGRKRFFELAYEYLPKDTDSKILDIGCGSAEFVRLAGLNKKYKNLYLLDSNKETLEKLAVDYNNVKFYKIPDKLNFKEKSVDCIHLSHIVEHLNYDDLYKFIIELDKTLAKDGILVISTPLLWYRFYDDLSHIKPYNPQVFINYLCKPGDERSASNISTNYSVLNLVYRYHNLPLIEGWSSKYLLIDVAMQIVKRITSLLGFRYQIRNGYTLILKKIH